MVKIINLIENGYDFEYNLTKKSNIGEFEGTIKIYYGPRLIYGSKGEHYWYDFIEYGIAIIDDEDKLTDYTLIHKGRSYTLRDIMRDSELLYEIIKDIAYNGSPEQLVAFLYLSGLESLQDYVSRSADVYQFNNFRIILENSIDGYKQYLRDQFRLSDEQISEIMPILTCILNYL